VFALIIPAFTLADGSAGQGTGAAHPTGEWADSDNFFTWAGAVWLHIDFNPIGHGRGYVRSFPLLIDCPNACTRPYDPGSTVVLTEHPSTGFAFLGWEGTACKGTAETCTFTITADTIVTADFEDLNPGNNDDASGDTTGGAGSSSVILHVNNERSGTIGGGSEAGGISCPSSCTAKFPPNTPITLNAPDDATQWIDPNNGGGQGCSKSYSFTIVKNTTITANDEC
jgi:hypothetical protein